MTGMVYILLVATGYPVPYQLVELMQWPPHLELEIDRSGIKWCWEWVWPN